MTRDLDNIKIPQPNGSLMLAWQVKDKHVLIVGGGDVAISRVNHLLQANAKITIIAKEIDPLLHKYNELGLLEKLEEREFKIEDLTMYETPSTRTKLNHITTELKSLEDNDELLELIENFDRNEKFSMVLTAINDYQLSLLIYYNSKKLGLNVNLADKPANCDFYFGSVYRKGYLQLMISTNGKSPRFANRLKINKLKPIFDELNVDNAVASLGYLRKQLKEVVYPGEENQTIKTRMEWNKKITDFYSIEEWCDMDKDKIDKILKLYPDLPKEEDL